MRLLILAATLLTLPAPAAGAEPTETSLAALGDLVPPHHELRRFGGPPRWYEYRPPPEVRYAQPDFEGWAAGLAELASGPPAGPFTALWRDAGGGLRYVLSRGESGGRLFSIDGDHVQFEDPGFHTQVGVARWGWVYEEGRLRTHRTWRLALGPPAEQGQPGPLAPTALFAVTDYDYRAGAAVPHRSRTYWSEADRRAGRWGQKTWYDETGRHRKTKHNPERPYPY